MRPDMPGPGRPADPRGAASPGPDRPADPNRSVAPARRRASLGPVPVRWVARLAALLLLPLVAGAPDVALIATGLYLIGYGLWSLVRRSTWLGVLGRRAAAGVAAGGLVVVLAGGAAAGPPAEPATPRVQLEASTAGVQPSAAPAVPTPGATGPDTVDETGGAPSSPTSVPPSAPTAAGVAGEPAVAGPGTALAAVQLLDVKGRAPRTGYDRDHFGSGWVDTDRNGCDTRNDMLARDLTATTFRPGTRDCVVVAGTLADPYSGATISFVRGDATSNAVQIDHVVALSDAWQKGAQQWDAQTRVRFGNDPMNLLAVDGPLNMQKGAGDTATWLPPNRGFRCAYVARQVGVKYTYGLWVTQAERDAMVRVLSTCPDEPFPADATVPAAAAAAAGRGAEPPPAMPPTPAAAPVPAPAPAPAVPAPAPADVPFENCSAARAAGAAPVRVGQPGYGTHLDGDRDGVGCE